MDMETDSRRVRDVQPMTARRFFPLEEVRVSQADDGTRHIDWYASVFDSLSEDLGGFRERIGRRAFTKTLAEADVRALFNHDPNFVMGRNRAGTLTLKIDMRGLHSSVAMPETTWARDLMVSVERGDISAGSFGFQVVKDRWNQEADGLITRDVLEVKLFDVSLVTYPAYPDTDGASIRTVLTAEEQTRVQTILSELRTPSTPEPPTDAAGHSVAAEARRRKLRLLALKIAGGR